MDTAAALILALTLAVLVVAVLAKPTKTLVGGMFQKDKKGRMTLVLTPVPKKRRKRKKK